MVDENDVIIAGVAIQLVIEAEFSLPSCVYYYQSGMNCQKSHNGMKKCLIP